MFSNRAISITAPRLWNDLPPELRTISLPPPLSLSITRHPSPLPVTTGSGVQRVLDARGNRGFCMPPRSLYFSCQFVSKISYDLFYSFLKIFTFNFTLLSGCPLPYPGCRGCHLISS